MEDITDLWGFEDFFRPNSKAYSFDSIEDILENITSMSLDKSVINILGWCDFLVNVSCENQRFYFSDHTGKIRISPTFFCEGVNDVNYKVSEFTFSENCNGDGKPREFKEYGYILIHYMKPGDENNPWDKISTPGPTGDYVIHLPRRLILPRKRKLELITAV